jgi:hypothetical protein
VAVQQPVRHALFFRSSITNFIDEFKVYKRSVPAPNSKTILISYPYIRRLNFSQSEPLTNRMSLPLSLTAAEFEKIDPKQLEAELAVYRHDNYFIRMLQIHQYSERIEKKEKGLKYKNFTQWREQESKLFGGASKTSQTRYRAAAHTYTILHHAGVSFHLMPTCKQAAQRLNSLYKADEDLFWEVWRRADAVGNSAIISDSGVLDIQKAIAIERNHATTLPRLAAPPQSQSAPPQSAPPQSPPPPPPPPPTPPPAYTLPTNLTDALTCCRAALKKTPPPLPPKPLQLKRNNTTSSLVQSLAKRRKSMRHESEEPSDEEWN